MATTMPASVRLIELDALRGFAVMGILAMNIMAFAMPEMSYIDPSVYGGAQGADLAAWIAAFILFDGKMRGLFSLLFGASLMLIVMRAEEARDKAEAAGGKGRSPARIHYSRMAWLAIFGLLHFYFIWWGDILFLYAIMGSVAFLFRHWEPRRLIRWALGGYLLGALLLSFGVHSVLSVEENAIAPGASVEAQREYGEMLSELDADADSVREDLARHRGDYWSITRPKLTEDSLQPLLSPLIMVFETLPLMMLGMALMKTGFLTGRAGVARYRMLALGGIPFGLAAYGALAWLLVESGLRIGVAMNIQVGWSMVPRLAMTIGYLSALILLIRRFAGSTAMARVAAAGRAAFTNYLGTSILMTTIFYGYGLGLYGHVGRAELYLFVLGAWALMLLWSKPWLARFRYGPFEWLWRSLARGCIQPIRA